MKKLFITLLFALSFVAVNAQDWYTPEAYSEQILGYVITQDGERIESKMFIHNPWAIASRISFAHPDIQKEGKKTKFKLYKAGTFPEYGFNGLKFVSKKLPSMGKAYLLVLIDGKASYYEYYEEVDRKREIIHYIGINGKLMPTNDIRLAKFKKGGAKLFADCKPVADKIANGEYTINDIETIIKEYNELKK